MAILISDVHLQITKPLARAEEDWLAVQARRFKELRALVKQTGAPIICAGDLFDQWKSCPELINWAMENVPPMYCIPGQHDLPLHNYEDMHKSAFWTLVSAGVIQLITPHPDRLVLMNEAAKTTLVVHAFPWGCEVRPHELDERNKKRLHLAVVHAYIWTKSTGYVGADRAKRLGAYVEKLKGYDAAVFGDNHIPFLVTRDDAPTVLNHGAFIPRRQNERPIKPAAGLLLKDGTIELHPYDISHDEWNDRADSSAIETADDFDMADLVDELGKLGHEGFDFVDATKRYFKSYEVSTGARNLILRTFDKHSDQ